MVVFEEVRRHLGTSAAHAFGGYLAHLTAWAEAYLSPTRAFRWGTIKRHIAGKGNADKAAIDAVRLLGFLQPVDDNEADALGAAANRAIAQGIRSPMNGAMLAQQAAGVIEHRERIDWTAGRELHHDRRTLVAGARDYPTPAQNGLRPIQSQAGAAHSRSVVP